MRNTKKNIAKNFCANRFFWETFKIFFIQTSVIWFRMLAMIHLLWDRMSLFRSMKLCQQSRVL